MQQPVEDGVTLAKLVGDVLQAYLSTDRTLGIRSIRLIETAGYGPWTNKHILGPGVEIVLEGGKRFELPVIPQ